MEGQLLSKLYDMGVLNTSAKLSDIENKLTVAAFCRRRLAVFMCMSKMSETVSAVCISPWFCVGGKPNMLGCRP
jgi:U3 small nucleolar ribonucleoprotein protein IMP3